MHRDTQDAVEALLSLRYPVSPIRHTQPNSHAHGTSHAHPTDTHDSLDHRRVRAPVPPVNFPFDGTLHIGPGQVYPPPQSPTTDLSTITNQRPTSNQPPFIGYQQPAMHQPGRQSFPGPSHTADPPTISPPRSRIFNTEPTRGGPSAQRSAYLPSARPLGPKLAPILTGPSPPRLLPSLRSALHDPVPGPLSPMRQVSSSSPSIPKSSNWSPNRGDENSSPHAGPSTGSTGPAGPSPPQGRPRTTSLRNVSGGATGQNVTSYTDSTTTATHSKATIAALVLEPFGEPVGFTAPEQSAGGKRKGAPQPKAAKHDPAGTASSSKLPRNRGKGAIKVFRKLSSAVPRPFKRTRTADVEPSTAPNPKAEAQLEQDESEQDELNSDEEFQPEPMAVDQLNSDQDALLRPMTKELKHALQLKQRRKMETINHKQIAEAKLANFKAGKINAYAEDHPLYNPKTNIDEWLMPHWSVWGTQDLKYQLESHLYNQFTDEEQRIISTRRTKTNEPHRDLPKSVRMLYYAKYTDIADIPRSEDLACRRCVLGGVQCHQTRMPKTSKTFNQDGTPALPSCVACECSKGGCLGASQKGVKRKPRSQLDFQVWLDRMVDPNSWPNFPPIDLAALPPPFSFNPLDRLLQNSAGKGEGRSATKRAAEEDEEFEAEQPRAKRVSLEPQTKPESGAKGALRRATSKASLTGKTSIVKAKQIIKNVKGKAKQASQGKNQ